MTSVICSDSLALPFILPIADRTIPFPDEATFNQAIKAEDTWLISRWLDQVPNQIQPRHVTLHHNEFLGCTWFGWLDKIACLPHEALNRYQLSDRILTLCQAFETYIVTHRIRAYSETNRFSADILHGDAFVYYTLFRSCCHQDYVGLVELLLSCPAVRTRLTVKELCPDKLFLSSHPDSIGAILAVGQYSQEELQQLACAIFEFYEGLRLSYVVKDHVEIFIHNGLDVSFLEEKFPNHLRDFLAVPEDKRIVHLPYIAAQPKTTLRALYAEKIKRSRRVQSTIDIT